MADIFVSYSRQDKARAAQFVQLFEDFGWDVFWDQETRAGTIWPKVLEDELGLARCLLVLWTANSVASRWVRIEAYEALQGDKLLPVRLENVKPPMEFRQTQTFDLIGWAGGRDDPRLDHLIADLCSLAKLEPRRGTLGPATLTAVRTLAPVTLGVSTWQAPATRSGAPDFSGHRAPTYRSVGVATPTPTPHEREPLHQVEPSSQAEPLPFADTQASKSDALPAGIAGTVAPERNDRAAERAGTEVGSGAAAIEPDPLRRRLSWGLGFAAVAIAGVWIASSVVAPGDVTVKEAFKPDMVTKVPDPDPPATVVVVPAQPTGPATPPVKGAKPISPTSSPHSPSSRCIEITERFQQTGQLTAEERQFLSSRECAR